MKDRSDSISHFDPFLFAGCVHSNLEKTISFTKKTKAKIKAKILTLDKEMAKHSKEYFVIQEFLRESEKKENETDNIKKINHKINSI